MKVRYSPLVSQASGSAGPVTASRWKGISYVRERITPANPNTDPQKDHRALLTKVVAWWHDLEDQVVAAINALAENQPYSGFNAFTKRNLGDLADTEEHAPVDPRIIPLNTPVNPITSFSATTGDGTNQIDFTWSQGDATAGDKMYILAGTVAAPGDMPTNLFVADKDSCLVETETLQVHMPDPNQCYFLAGIVEKAVPSGFSVALCVWATSDAA